MHSPSRRVRRTQLFRTLSFYVLKTLQMKRSSPRNCFKYHRFAALRSRYRDPLRLTVLPLCRPPDEACDSGTVVAAQCGNTLWYNADATCDGACAGDGTDYSCCNSECPESHAWTRRELTLTRTLQGYILPGSRRCLCCASKQTRARCSTLRESSPPCVISGFCSRLKFIGLVLR